MSKGKIDKSKLKLATKKPVVKTTDTAEHAEKAVQNIHPAINSVAPATEKVVRFTMDLPEDIHRYLKLLSAQSGVTIKNHITDLIKKEMEAAPKK